MQNTITCALRVEISHGFNFQRMHWETNIPHEHIDAYAHANVDLTYQMIENKTYQYFTLDSSEDLG